jgi:hypothetical protein
MDGSGRSDERWAPAPRPALQAPCLRSYRLGTRQPLAPVSLPRPAPAQALVQRRHADDLGATTAFACSVAEAALAHVVGDKVEAAYRRGDLFEKRRKLMAAWATFCTTPAEGVKVIPMAGGRALKSLENRLLSIRANHFSRPRSCLNLTLFCRCVVALPSWAIY